VLYLKHIVRGHFDGDIAGYFKQPFAEVFRSEFAHGIIGESKAFFGDSENIGVQFFIHHNLILLLPESEAQIG